LGFLFYGNCPTLDEKLFEPVYRQTGTRRGGENPQLIAGDFFMVHFVYILHSTKLNRFYIGETANLALRIEFYQNSMPHKFTAKAKDWTLFHKIECENKKQAVAIEKHIKRLKAKLILKILKNTRR
jgi:putative endonuclease